MELRRSIAEYRAGRVRNMDKALGDLDARQPNPAKGRQARRRK
jgi:hypothetical protein